MKISIIIPAFNAEKYIKECVQSVIENNYSDLEIVIINDGSTDRTGELIDELKADYIKTIHTENRGQSAARNTGIAQSTGDYIIFLDSDDKLHHNALFRLAEKIANTQSDIVFFESDVFFDDESLAEKFNPVYERNEKLTCHKLSGVDFFKMSIQNNNYIVSPCLFIANREAMKGITFKEGIIHEDNIFTTNLLLNKEINVFCIKEKLHLRRVRQGSVMTQLKGDRHLDGYHTCIMELINNPPKNSNLALPEYHTFLCHMVDCFKYTNLEIINSLKKEAEEKNKKHESEIHQCKVDILELKNSSSWKITAPLRKIKDLLIK